MSAEHLPDLRKRLEILEFFSTLAKRQDASINDAEFAKKLDAMDQIGHLRQRFSIPSNKEILEGRKHVDGERWYYMY